MKKYLKMLYNILITFVLIAIIVFCAISIELWINDKPSLLSPIPEKTPLNIVTPSSSPKINPHKINRLYEISDSRLDESAYIRAKCIAEGECEWSHDGWKETIASQIKYTRAGEVLARDFGNWRQVMDAWRASESHRKVLDDDWCIYGESHYENIFVMHFACE